MKDKTKARRDKIIQIFPMSTQGWDIVYALTTNGKVLRGHTDNDSVVFYELTQKSPELHQLEMEMLYKEK
jgi:hypothetical protein